MTVAEYNAEFARCQTRLAWRMAASIAVVFAMLGLAGIVRYNNPGLADTIAPIIIFAVGLPLMLLGFVHADRTYRLYPCLVCPHCEGSLARQKPVVIATGNCPSCGRRVLDDASIGA